MTHNTVDYAAIIRAQGYRLTPQRKAVLDAVCMGQGHLTCEDVLRQVQAASIAVDQSTVYRALSFLTGIGLIASAEIDGKRVYEIAVGSPDHHHLHCRVCGTALEIDNVLLAEAFNAIEQVYGFRPVNNHLVLQGVCEACRCADVSP